MYKLGVYIPEQALETVKDAMFATGAGRIGLYQRCCWQVKGQGQFEPLPGSRPYLGSQGVLQRVDEWRVELVCEPALIHDLIDAMKKAHPYEEPAYDVLRLEAL